jgi:hypothetical protein
MKIARSFRIVLITLASLIALVVILIILSISKIDRSIDYQVLLDTMNARIKAVDNKPIEPAGGFTIGFAKVNLTPPEPRSTAGYGKRLGKHYEAVHDSIYVRTIVVDNGIQRVAIVSADLLIIPPTVTALLEQQLPEVNFTLDNTYLGATHSHNSIGNWATGATSFMYGMYEDSVVQFIANKIKASILQASVDMLPATVSIDSVAIPDGVRNRIDDDGPVDPLLRMLRIERSDSIKILITSYTAHATCLFSRDLELSGDYPGRLVRILESQGYDFAMFLAGAVGSHKPRAPEGGWQCVEWMAEKIADNVMKAKFKPMESTLLEMHRVPLALSKPQPKVLHEWRLKPGLFKIAFGDYPSFISALRFGDAVLLGTPCDFSGEFNSALDSLAAKAGVFQIVTSFNGGYIGYVTPEKYYDIDHYETQLMNWYGPGNGEYVKETLEMLLLSIAD